jgi:hypothetical protein
MKRNKALNFIKFSLIGFLAVAFLGIMPAQAIENPIIFEPQIGVPGFDTKTPMTESSITYIGQMIKAFYDYGLAIGGILAAIVLMAGGLIWLVSGGSSDKITQAKGLIMGSIIGIGLLFGAWIILNTINPYLLDFRIRGIKGVVPMFIADGEDGFIDSVGSLPKDTIIKYECVGFGEHGFPELCDSLYPPSINLTFSLCKDKEDIICSGNTPIKVCCGQSEEVTQEMDQQCLNKNEGTLCKATPTDPDLNSFCHNNKCYSKKVCCQCGQGCVLGVCVIVSCRNDLTVKECNEWCYNSYINYGTSYYAGGSENYICSGGDASRCIEK